MSDPQKEAKIRKYTLIGAGVGAVIGLILGILGLLYCIKTGNGVWGTLALSMGFPAGLLAGAVIGMGIANK